MDQQREKTFVQLKSHGNIHIKVISNDLKQFLEMKQVIKNKKLRKKGTDKYATPALYHEVKLDTRKLANTSVKITELASIGATSIAAGAVATIGAYTLVSVAGTASTGTSIASLFGAAKYNATIAWFGNGSVAIGSAGMTGGTLMLSGIGNSSSIAVAGLLMDKQAERKLEEAYKIDQKVNVAVGEMNELTYFLKTLSKKASYHEEVIREYQKKYTELQAQMQKVVDENLVLQRNRLNNRIRRLIKKPEVIHYGKISTQDKIVIDSTYEITRILHALIATPL